MFKNIKMGARAVGYARVSTEGQAQNTSIDNQIEDIMMFCKLQNIELVEIFADEGFSGASYNREGYNEMLDYIQDADNNIDILVVYSADRVHRSLKHLFEMLNLLEDIGVQFMSVYEQFDTHSAHGRLLLQMMGSFAEFERKAIIERTTRGRMKRAKENKFVGGRIPYGYFINEYRELVVKEEEAEVVKLMYFKRANGDSLNQIAKDLNRDNILTKYHNTWNKMSVKYVLKNEVYIGKYHYCGKKECNEIVIDIEPIVDERTYNYVQSLWKTKEESESLDCEEDF